MLQILKAHRRLMIQAAIFAAFPLVCAVLYCLKDGHTINDIYLPVSYWNDELIYYKQVEAVVNCGLPQGWFGFQEAHANVYPFAAWSPTILIPWVVWGKLFGWNLLSPVYANIVYSMASMGLFAVLVKPSVKQSVFLLGLTAAFMPYTRYLLCGMPESLFLAAGIVFAALTVSYIREERRWKLVLLFLLSVLVTIARPYLGLLFLIPVWFAVRKSRWKGLLFSCVIIAGTAGAYVLVTRLCCAPYLESIVKASWLGIFFTDGPVAGIRYVFDTLLDRFTALYRDHLKPAVKFGLFSGSLYGVVGLTALILLIRFLWAWRKGKDKDMRILALFQFLMTAGMVLAVFLFYKMGEGSKHLMLFILMSLVWIALTDEKYCLMKGAAAFLCLYFFVIKAFIPYDWQAAYDAVGMREEARLLEAQLDANMERSAPEGFSEPEEYRYANTVIWLASDIIEGESIPATWGLLYMIPEGYGINFCTQVYALEHFDELRSGYIAVLPGGQVEERILQAGGQG
ncbi:MAG: hypothetical protein NC517_08135 [Firmicutes bacterium]|nr:hypothetical protein [Bacillota bacterium]